jgi:hypothetical protein
MSNSKPKVSDDTMNRFAAELTANPVPTPLTGHLDGRLPNCIPKSFLAVARTYLPTHLHGLGLQAVVARHPEQQDRDQLVELLFTLVKRPEAATRRHLRDSHLHTMLNCP